MGLLWYQALELQETIAYNHNSNSSSVEQWLILPSLIPHSCPVSPVYNKILF